MSLTFLETLEKLTTASNEDEARASVKPVSEFLKNEEALNRMVIQGFYSELVESANLVPLEAEGLVKLRSAVYRDHDGDYKIALGVSYIQNYKNPDPDLDRKVLDKAMEILKDRNLGFLVNDLSINSLQVRDFLDGELL